MSQTEPQLEAFAKIAGMLEQVIFNGSTLDAAREFHTVIQPGIFLNPSIKESDKNDMARISEIANQTFDSTLLYNPQLTTVDQLYEDILTQSALPKKELTEDQEKELKTLEDQIKALYPSYKRYFDRYNHILGELYRARENEEADSVIVELENKRKDAWREWRLYGQKDRFEAADAEVQYYRQTSPRRHFADLRERYTESSFVAPELGRYQATYLEPPIEIWNSQNVSWTEFSKTFKYSELSKKSKHTKWSGSVGLNFGLFKRISIGANGEKEEKYQESKNTDIELKFEFLRVNILRPWLVPDVLGYRFWTYNKAFGYRDVSTGFVPGTSEPVGPKGLMPILPTSMIVARNVTISANFSEEEKAFIRETISGSVSGGWGFFSAKGSYSTTTTTEDVVGSFDGTTLRITHPQVIAYMGTLLPKCPNPNKLLPWEDDADFGDDVENLESDNPEHAYSTLGLLSSEAYLGLVEEQKEIWQSTLMNEE